jgi:hypothetical protein
MNGLQYEGPEESEWENEKQVCSIVCFLSMYVLENSLLKE